MSKPLLKEKFVLTGNGKIFYYADNSFPENPTVVFLHGLSSNHTTWIEPMKEMHSYGYNSIAWDMRGHGLSDKTIKKDLYSMPVFVNDLKRIFEQEKIKKAFIIGYSYGGSIAIQFALDYPELVAGLVLISTNHTNPLRYWGINFLTPLVYSAYGLLAFIFLLYRRKEYHYYRHRESRGYFHSVFKGFITMPASVNIWMLMQARWFDFRKNFGSIQVPVLIIHAKSDPFLTQSEVNDMVKALPQAEVIIPKISSHFLATRSQEEITEIILNFLHRLS